MNRCLMICLCGVVACVVQAAEPVSVAALPDGVKQVEVFILAGQSNMKGRGAIPEIQPEEDRILFMSMGNHKWYVARHPLHKRGVPDAVDPKDNAGVGPGLDFARAMADAREDVLIALVPCAIGGSTISLWVPGAKLYESAIRRGKKALADFPKGTARIAGILWLQGESDAVKDDVRHTVYQEKLDRMIASFRTELETPDLPFVACTIGSFIKKKHRKFDFVDEVNEMLLTLPERVPHTACVDARDLTEGHIGDFMHYNTAAQVEIGKRMAKKYLTLTEYCQKFNENNDTGERLTRTATRADYE